MLGKSSGEILSNWTKGHYMLVGALYGIGSFLALFGLMSTPPEVSSSDISGIYAANKYWFLSSLGSFGVGGLMQLIGKPKYAYTKIVRGKRTFITYKAPRMKETVFVPIREDKVNEIPDYFLPCDMEQIIDESTSYIPPEQMALPPYEPEPIDVCNDLAVYDDEKALEKFVDWLE